MKLRLILISAFLWIANCDILPIRTPAPIAPSDLQLQQITPTMIQLSWQDNSDDEEGFKIDRRSDSSAWVEWYADLEANTVEWVDSSATAGVSYAYRVYAYGADSTSTPIEESMYAETPVPIAPSDLQLHQITPTMIQLSWQDNSDDEEGFKIDRKSDSSAWVEWYADLEANTVEWVDSSATAGVSYAYRVYAYGADSTSTPIEESMYAETPAPIAPSDLQLQQIAPTMIQLSWQDNSDDEEGFKIDRRSDNSAWVEWYADLEVNTVAWVDSSATAGVSYAYRISAYGVDSTSTTIEESIYAITPAPIAPSDLQLQQISPTMIQLSWQDNSDDEKGFKIDRRSDNSAWVEWYADLESNTVAWVDSNATPGIYNAYRVSAYGLDSSSTALEDSMFIDFPIPTLSLISVLSEITVGDRLTVDIITENFREEYFAISMRIQFDEESLEFLSPEAAWLGTVWGDDAIGIVEQSEDLVYLSVTQIRETGNAALEGSIATLNFRTLKTGSTNLSVAGNDLLFYNDVGDLVNVADLELDSLSVIISE